MSLFFLFFLIAFLGGDAVWLIAARRTFKGDGRIRFVRYGCYVFIGLLGAALLSMLGGRLIDIRADGLIPRPLLITVFLWHFIGLAIGVAALVGVGVVRLIHAIRVTLERRRVRAQDDVAEEMPRVVREEEPTMTRRALLARAAVLTPVAATLAGAITAEFELNHFRIREIDVPLRALPSALDGMTIAHVTDVHLGRFTTNEAFRRIVNAANGLDCDLVLQTGDLINFDQRDLPAAAEMTHALRGRYGQFMCEGNHDLIEGRETFEKAAKELRLPILLNQIGGVTIGGVEVNLLGLPWLRVPRGTPVDAGYADSVARLAARRSGTSFPILLAHHPHAFDAAVVQNIPLTLAGHTHGGQLHLTKDIGFGPWMYRYWSGLYERNGRALVVSNGAGNWFPIRVNAPAEILRLTLRRGL